MNFVIEEKRYKIKKINNIKIKDYLSFKKINDSKLSLEKITKELFKLFSNIPINIIENIDYQTLPIINWDEFFITEEYSLSKEVPELNNIRFDKYINIDNVLLLTENEYLFKEINIATIMLLPNEYTPIEFETKRDYITNNYTLNDVLSIFNYYVEWRGNMIPNFPNLFVLEPNQDDGWDDGHIARNEISIDEEEGQEEETVNGWGDVIDNLANDNILKINEVLELPTLFVFNFLDRKIKRVKVNDKNN